MVHCIRWRKQYTGETKQGLKEGIPNNSKPTTVSEHSGAPNDGFLSDPFKRYFSHLDQVHFRLRYNILSVRSY